MRQLFNLLRFLNHFQRKNILVGLIHLVFQFRGQLEKLIGVGLEMKLALRVGLFSNSFCKRIVGSSSGRCLGLVVGNPG